MSYYVVDKLRSVHVEKVSSNHGKRVSKAGLVGTASMPTDTKVRMVCTQCTSPQKRGKRVRSNDGPNRERNPEARFLPSAYLRHLHRVMEVMVMVVSVRVVARKEEAVQDLWLEPECLDQPKLLKHDEKVQVEHLQAVSIGGVRRRRHQRSVSVGHAFHRDGEFVGVEDDVLRKVYCVLLLASCSMREGGVLCLHCLPHHLEQHSFSAVRVVLSDSKHRVSILLHFICTALFEQHTLGEP